MIIAQVTILDFLMAFQERIAFDKVIHHRKAQLHIYVACECTQAPHTQIDKHHQKYIVESNIYSRPLVKHTHLH